MGQNTASHTSHRDLVPRVHRELPQLNNKKASHTITNGAQDYTDISPKQVDKWAIRTREAVERNSNQNHNEIPLLSTRIAVIKQTDSNECW